MRIKVTVTVTREMEVERDWYPTGYTDDRILEAEIKYSEDLFHEWISADDVKYEHKGEIVKCQE